MLCLFETNNEDPESHQLLCQLLCLPFHPFQRKERRGTSAKEPTENQ